MPPSPLADLTPWEATGCAMLLTPTHLIKMILQYSKEEHRTHDPQQHRM
jgi:hypothetical protein